MYHLAIIGRLYTNVLIFPMPNASLEDEKAIITLYIQAVCVYMYIKDKLLFIQPRLFISPFMSSASMMRFISAR